jgi:O-antigen ligase
MYQFPLGTHFINIFVIALTFGWVIRAVYKGEKIVEHTSFNLILILLMVSTYISLWWGHFHMGFPSPLTVSDDRLISWKDYMILPLLYFIIVNRVKNIKQIKWLIVIMVLAIFLMDRYCMKQVSWMPSLESRDKIVGTFVWLGPNEVAAFYAQYTLILLGIFIFQNIGIKKIILGVLILLNFYCLLFLYSRGAYIAFIIALLFFSLIKKRALLIPLLFLVLFWQVILPKTVIERINYTTIEEGVLDSSVTTRLSLWRDSMDVVRSEPFMGIGFGGFPHLGLLKGDPHNIYLKTLVEQGILGLAIILFIFAFSLRSGWRLYKNSNDTLLKGLGLGFVACVISTMVGNFFGNRWTYIQLGSYYWIFLALVERGNIITRQQQKQNKKPLQKKIQ